MTELGRTFGLVRPVGMSDDAATEWLVIAAAELDGFRQDYLEQALAAARRECTHHAQIVPFVFKHMEERSNRYSFSGHKEPPRRPQPKIAAPREVSGLIEGAARALKAD